MSASAQPETFWVTAQPINEAAFEPFGRVLRASGQRRPIDLYGASVDVFHGGAIDADVPVEFLISRSRIREFRVRFLERHMLLAQSFFPLSGGGFIAAVARADAPLVDNGLPALAELRAFIAPPACGITLWRGTWHEPPFALADDHVRLTTSHAQLTAGLESQLNERGEIAALDVDKRNITERTGRVVRIALP